MLERPATIDIFDYDFDFFYTTFGSYVDPRVNRAGIDLANEMERSLNKLVFAEFQGMLINRYRGVARVKAELKRQRDDLLTPERRNQLNDLVNAVREFIAQGKYTQVVGS